MSSTYDSLNQKAAELTYDIQAGHTLSASLVAGLRTDEVDLDHLYSLLTGHFQRLEAHVAEMRSLIAEAA